MSVPFFAGLAADGTRSVINSTAAIQVLERQAFGPPRLAGEFIEERDVVGAFRRLADHFVDFVSVRPDENAPAISLDALEDDCRCLRRAGQCLITKTPLEFADEIAQLIVRQLRDIATQQSKALPRLCKTGSIDPVQFGITTVDLTRMGADRGPNLARHDRAFDVRRIDPQIGASVKPLTANVAAE